MRPPILLPPSRKDRRRLLAAAALAMLGARAQALPRMALRFPSDHGAHPDLRTEWWYLTGALQAGERLFGFQLTFFRSRVDGTQAMQSAFAARQLVFAHAALSDVQGQRLWHDQRLAREGFGIAAASQTDTAVTLRGWSLLRSDAGYALQVVSQDFALALQCAPTQPVLLQGDEGLSRKGPEEVQASYYYSQPQLQTRGRITLQGKAFDVAGAAWLDHEWSDELLHPEAAGWDWIGMNLLDGSALTAFRLRRKGVSAAPQASLWDGGSFRSAQGVRRVFQNGEVMFTQQRYWTSPATQTRYPVEWALQTPAGTFTVKALIDNQELDSRNSTGSIYWEGLSELLDSQGKAVGHGYLEMTGYAGPLRM